MIFWVLTLYKPLAGLFNPLTWQWCHHLYWTIFIAILGCMQFMGFGLYLPWRGPSQPLICGLPEILSKSRKECIKTTPEMTPVHEFQNIPLKEKCTAHRSGWLKKGGPRFLPPTTYRLPALAFLRCQPPGTLKCVRGDSSFSQQMHGNHYFPVHLSSSVWSS